MEFFTEAKKFWNVVRSPRAIAVFKLAAAVMGVGVAIEGLAKSLKNEVKTDSTAKSSKKY